MPGKPPKSAVEKALRLLRSAPRLDPELARPNPGQFTLGRQVTKVHNKAGHDHDMLQKAAKPPLGYIFGDWFTPWHRRFPGDPSLNKDAHLKREYPPLSLLELQRLIDVGFVDASRPIDLAALCNTKEFACDPLRRQFGVQLTAEGADVFSAVVDIEVQHACDEAIAAVERVGGRLVSAYFDPVSLIALTNPQAHLESGEPIPRRGFPPPDIIAGYVGAARRGYLADPAAVAAERVALGQRFGYEVPSLAGRIAEEPLKDPLQVFHGLRPGWVVSLADRAILKPLDPELAAYYEPPEPTPIAETEEEGPAQAAAAAK